MKLATVLFRNGLLCSGAGSERPSAFYGWLLVRGTLIEDVGMGEAPQGDFDRVIDASQRAIIPGLVNAHAHSHSTLTRGSAEGLPLEGWLRVIEMEQSRLSDEQAYAAALATYCEALLSGTTTIVDMCLRPQPALQAAWQIGIRATIAPYVALSKPFAPTLAGTERLLLEHPGQAERVRVWVGLHDLESCGDEQVQAGADLARRHGAGLHLHCAETRSSVEQTRRRTGLRPVQRLKELGVLGPRTLLAHCVWVDEGDIELLASTGTSVAHCPIANLKLGSGCAPVPEMRKRGVTVALGTDGAKANNNLDMFDVAKTASLLHKGIHLDPALLPAGEVLTMATSDGGRALGLPVGRLEAGRPADLALVRLDQIRLQPATPDTVITNLVHAAHGTDIDLVMVDGQIVVEGGRLVTMDGEAIGRQAQAAGESLLVMESRERDSDDDS
jgi:5-methylthioadenosine/S-adenosylhomocysteine deaminase